MGVYQYNQGKQCARFSTSNKAQNVYRDKDTILTQNVSKKPRLPFPIILQTRPVLFLLTLLYIIKRVCHDLMYL